MNDRVESRRAYVTEISGGRLGYVHRFWGTQLSEALDPITRVAVRDVALTTDTSLTVMSGRNETVVRPETKPEPVNVTGTVA